MQMAVWREAMAKDLIRYDLLVQDAMRGVMRKVLSDVAENGYLPGDHHFTISFRTDAPGVTISRRLAEQWPRELTIILQHQYSNLEVDDDGFGVTLSFRSIPEHLYVPFAAVTGFFDPAVEFGLSFEDAEDDAERKTEERIAAAGPSLVKKPEPVRELSRPKPSPPRRATGEVRAEQDAEPARSEESSGPSKRKTKATPRSFRSTPSARSPDGRDRQSAPRPQDSAIGARRTTRRR